MRTRLRRGDIVQVACATAEMGRGPLRALVVIASENGESLAVMYDGILDGCVNMLPLLWRDGAFRSIVTQRPIDVLVDLDSLADDVEQAPGGGEGNIH